MQYLTRIGYNGAGWRKPTGDAARIEQGSYNQMYGFGHEDWLFRDEWLLGDWRYAFIQGVNKSYLRLVREGKPFDLRLFCVEPDGRRRYVAEITDVECIDDDHAEAALKDFEAKGWLTLMKQEITEVGGDPTALGLESLAHHILNLRFRPDSVRHFEPNLYAEGDDPVLSYKRYQLIRLEKARETLAARRGGLVGSSHPPSVAPFARRGSEAQWIDPIHAMMQKALMRLLRVEHPDGQVVREVRGIDVLLRTESGRFLYEIKSDLAPRMVIRQALGQLLEYAHSIGPDERRPMSLIIVGRKPLNDGELRYFKWLQSTVSIPISYRAVSPEDQPPT